MRIGILAHNADAAVDQPFIRKSRTYIKTLLGDNRARIMDGKTADDTRLIQLFEPIDRMELKTRIQETFGWRMPFGRMRSSALNEGRCGQFNPGPIPYAWTGYHTKFLSSVKTTNATA